MRAVHHGTIVQSSQMRRLSALLCGILVIASATAANALDARLKSGLLPTQHVHSLEYLASSLRTSGSVPERCADQRVHALIVAAQGRSGSSFLLNLLAAAPDTFVIPEPFYHWRQDKDRKPKPSYTQLFNCQYLRRPDMRNLVVWPYACQNMPFFTRLAEKNQGSLRPCYNGNLPKAVWEELYNECINSCVRVVKTVRPLEHFPEDDEMAALNRQYRLAAVQLVRKPFDIFFSQWKQGWHTEIKGLDASSYDTESLAKAMAGPCNFGVQLANKFHRLPLWLEQELIFYEQFQRDSASEIVRLVAHHHAYSLTRTMVESITQRLHDTHFGPRESIQKLPDNIDLSTAIGLAAEDEQCKEYFRLLYPNAEPTDSRLS